MQLTYSLDGSKISANSFTSAVPSPLASMALWKVRRHRTNSSVGPTERREGGRGRGGIRGKRREGKGRERRGEEGGVIRYVTSKLAAVLMQQG